MADLNATALWTWARGYAKRQENSGRGTQYPTMREATKRFRCTMDDIENIVGDDLDDDDKYLGLGVAWRVGTGIATIETRGDYVIEAY